MITKKSRPLKIIYDNLLREIISITNEWNIKKIIIGFPVSDTKKEGIIQKEIKCFSNELKKID